MKKDGFAGRAGKVTTESQLKKLHGGIFLWGSKSRIYRV
jgi:hypothetical protein